jgi:acetyl esterase/lipase
MARIPDYDPNARYEVRQHEVEYRHDGERGWKAFIYEPVGAGPFPAVIDIHGGAWAAGNPLQNATAQNALAASGLVVATIEFRTSVNAPHPAAMEDISYATRWLKAHARDFNATADGLGGIGWSSGGHQILLTAMRPRQYDALPLAEAPQFDASLAYAVLGWPVIDPISRFRMAQSGNVRRTATGGDASDTITRHLAYFGDEAGQIEANPQLMLERGEKVETPPVLIVQGAADEGLTRMMAENFVEAYSIAGGVIELGKYPGEPHGFMRDPGPNTDRATAMIKSFIARHLAELRDAD